MLLVDCGCRDLYSTWEIKLALGKIKFGNFQNVVEIVWTDYLLPLNQGLCETVTQIGI